MLRIISLSVFYFWDFWMNPEIHYFKPVFFTTSFNNLIQALNNYIRIRRITYDFHQAKKKLLFLLSDIIHYSKSIWDIGIWVYACMYVQ